MYYLIAYITHRLWWRLASLLLVMVIAAHFTGTPTQNPLGKYQDLEPGMDQTALNGYSVVYSNIIFDPQMSMYYEIHPKDDSIKLIQVTVHNGLIVSVFFATDTLKLADVVALWGVPRRDRSYETYQTFIWDCGLQAVTYTKPSMPPQPRSLFMPISYVVMTQNFSCGGDP